MKRITTLAASMLVLATTVARAQTEAYDCCPACPAAAEPPAAARDLCDYGAVRDAERVSEKLKPAREIYDIALNPTGFAMKMVDEHVVHIPKWVGIAMDPKGAARSYVIDRVRDAAKKQVGLARDCRAPEANDGGVAAPASGTIADIFPPRSL